MSPHSEGSLKEACFRVRHQRTALPLLLIGKCSKSSIKKREWIRFARVRLGSEKPADPGFVWTQTNGFVAVNTSTMQIANKNTHLSFLPGNRAPNLLVSSGGPTERDHRLVKHGPGVNRLPGFFRCPSKRAALRRAFHRDERRRPFAATRLRYFFANLTENLSRLIGAALGNESARATRERKQSGEKQTVASHRAVYN